MKGLTGRRVIISGGGGGIGRKVAERLLEEGASVTLFDISEAAAQEAAELLQPGGGSRVTPLQVDITDEESVRSGVEAAYAAMGGIDGVVSNAAVPARATVVDLPLENFEKTMATDVRGLFLLTKYAVPHMLENPSGSIVATSSMQGVMALPGRFAYSASKGAVSAAVRQLAVDFGPVGIRANGVVPGAIVHAAGMQRLKTTLTPEAFAKLPETYPLRRLGLPEDVASAVCFLLSDEASWITGVNLMVDGGATVQLAEALISSEYQPFWDGTAELAEQRRAGR